MPHPHPVKTATFEIGLVMAGAISAGAYTAGVIDFLIQALDEWQKAKESNQPNCPQHDVKIKVMASASAGGMTSALVSALINGEFTPVTSMPDSIPDESTIKNNILYSSWVKDIHILKLLSTDDLKDKNSPVKSILNSNVLDAIANSAINFTPTNFKRNYISDELHVYLTVTNLRGVPYSIYLEGATGEGHALSLHRDYMHFVLSERDPKINGTVWLNPNDPAHPNWKILKQSALATGAFPLGLAPRELSRESKDYDKRKWPIPQPPFNSIKGTGKCVNMKEIPPNWPQEFCKDRESFEYKFLCVDGGVIDNEPLELARRELAGEDIVNHRDPQKAKRAVVMIDPFPSVEPITQEEAEGFANYDMIKVFTQMFTSLKQQARFKIDELELAQSEHVYSRFLIAPTRSTKNNVKEKYPIASGTLGGFGGFLSEMFRIHDYQLGRRNCQQFLRRYFVLPLQAAKKNPVFAGQNSSQLEKYKVKIKGKDWIQIIPLLGTADKEVLPFEWNDLKVSDEYLNELKIDVKKRTKMVVNRLISHYISGFIARNIIKIIALTKRGAIVDTIMKMIKNDLEKYKLY